MSECGICLCESEDKFIKSFDCNHTFHEKCINIWINDYSKTTCPCCRSCKSIYNKSYIININNIYILNKYQLNTLIKIDYNK